MYLSHLELVGFKSFANKTHVRFNSGITGIVGPNGCGKTNIVDAMRWVLGEQKSSTLRSDKMDDVIFNGTKSRKPVGMAEASITIQNNRSILPSEYSEITLTRRLFRNGESQYLLNKVPCRLKDITNLFMDTGIGTNAYSVIELKMIETILSDKAEERRKLFEEAAGVTKYKIRRKEAQRKMQSVQADVARVKDIVAEVEKNVRSLQRQAGRARRYQELTAELKTLEKSLLIEEFGRLSAEMKPLKEEIHATKKAKEEWEAELRDLEVVVAEMEAEQSERELSLQAAQTEVSEQVAVVNTLGRELAVARERLAALDRTRQRLERERDEAGSQVGSYERRHDEAERRIDALVRELDGAKAELERRREAHRVAQQATQELRTKEREAKNRVMDCLGAIRAITSGAERNAARIESLTKRIEETKAQLQKWEQELSSLADKHDAEEQKMPSYDASVQAAEKVLAERQEYQAQLRREIDALQAALSEKQRVGSHISASLEFLTGLADTNDTAQYLAKAKEWQPTRRVTFAEVIGADDSIRVALEAALGEAAKWWVVDTVEEAQAGIGVLRKGQKGKLTFLALERVPASVPAAEAIEDMPGVVGWAAELIRAEDKIRSAARLVMSGVLIVSDLEAARPLLDSGRATTLVSLEGEMLSGAGLVRGGGSKKTEGAFIGRIEQIEKLKAEQQALVREIGGLKADVESKSAEYRALNMGSYNDAIRKAEQQRSEFRQYIGRIAYQVAAMEKQVEQATSAIVGFTTEIANIRAAGGDELPRLEELERQKVDAEREAVEAEKNAAEAEDMLRDYAEEFREAEMTAMRLAGDERGVRQELERLSQQIRSAEDRARQRGEELQRAMSEQTELVAVLADLDRQIEAAEEAAKEVQEQRDEIADMQREFNLRIRRQAEELRLKRREHEQAVSKLHGLELKHNDLHNRAESCVRKAREDHELDLRHGENVLPDEFNVGEARTICADIRQKLQQFGGVNLLAAEEFEKESERLEFLNGQLKDLQESEDTLSKTIDEINQTAQKQFAEVFAVVRDNFIRIFQSLFEEGDEADLRLEDGDPLEAKVEIIAKPRGKRPHSIEMLSGGEKTLTAIALLFAIYLVKPSPFCILDEVDAPLDDANIDRYIRIIREFSKNTQFIMITHNKRTMQAADALYGVTMEEEGISKLVSVRFTDDQQAAAATPVSLN